MGLNSEQRCGGATVAQPLLLSCVCEQGLNPDLNPRILATTSVRVRIYFFHSDGKAKLEASEGGMGIRNRGLSECVCTEYRQEEALAPGGPDQTVASILCDAPVP